MRRYLSVTREQTEARYRVKIHAQPSGPAIFVTDLPTIMTSMIVASLQHKCHASAPPFVPMKTRERVQSTFGAIR